MSRDIRTDNQGKLGIAMMVIGFGGALLILLLGILPAQMNDVRVDNTKFFFIDEIGDFEPLIDVDDKTAGFVQSKVRDEVYIEDGRPVVYMYITCWHELQHLKGKDHEDMQYEVEDGEVVDRAPLWEMRSPTCAKVMIQGFKTFGS